MGCSFCGSSSALSWYAHARSFAGCISLLLSGESLRNCFRGSAPLTQLENWLEARAGVEPYQGGFLLHYLDRLVYPDISPTVLTAAGVFVCALNLALYARQIWSTLLICSAK